MGVSRAVRKGLAVAAAAIAVTLVLPVAAGAVANEYTVNTPGDSGDGGCNDGTCTWRDAINLVFNDDVNNDQDIIRVDLDDPATSTIVLTSGDTNPIDEALSIVNIGEARPVISGGGLERTLQINTPDHPGAPVQITGIGFTDGAAQGGAGLQAWNASLTLTDVTITDNVSTGVGGGIQIVNAGVTIQNSTIAGNHVTSDDPGGGISAFDSTVIVRGSTVSGNSTALRGGGGILLRSGAGLTLDRSTVSGNSAGGGSQNGGGIYADGSSGAVSLSISNSTIAGNQTLGGGDGGGIYTQDVSPEPVLSNTIVADNAFATFVGPLPSDIETLNDTFRLGFALVEEPHATPIDQVVPGSNLFGVDPRLQPLAANGGPTDTHLLGVNSPAEDMGSATLTDQRGVLRPVDVAHIPNSQAPGANGAEIGAVELTAAEATPDNEFSLGQLVRNKKRGTAVLGVTVPGPGLLLLSGSRVRGVEALVGAGPASLAIVATGKAARKLKRKGKAGVGFTVTYTPTGGTPNSKSTAVKLKKKKRTK